MNLTDTLLSMNYKDGTNYLINLLGEDGIKTILSNILIPRIEKERDITFDTFRVIRWHVSRDMIRDYKTNTVENCRIRVFYSGDYIKGQSWTNDIKHTYRIPKIGAWTLTNEPIEKRSLYKGLESEVTVSISEFIPMYRDYVINSIVS